MPDHLDLRLLFFQCARAPMSGLFRPVELLEQHVAEFGVGLVDRRENSGKVHLDRRDPLQ